MVYRRLQLPMMLVATAMADINAQWTQVWGTDLSSEVAQPSRRSAHATIILEDFLYVYGGIGYSLSGDDEEYNDTWAFDLKNHNWTQLNQPTALPGDGPGTRFHVSGVLHSNESVSEFILFGGVSIEAAVTPDSTAKPSTFSTTAGVPVAQFNDVWRLALHSSDLNASVEWTNDPVMNSNDNIPAARSEAGIAALGDQLLVFGGISYDPPSDHGDLWSYDLSTFVWSQVVPASSSDIPPSRFSHSVAIFESGGTSYFLVFSGRHLNTQSDSKSSWRVLDDLWLFDLSSKLWIIVEPSGADMPPRAYTSIVSIGSSMWFFAGYYRPPQSASGYVFDDVVRGAITVNTASGDRTSSLSASASVDVEVAVLNGVSPTLRYNHAAALWRNDCMVVFGGSYQIPRGDVWILNTSQTETREPAAAALTRLPMGVETLVYVLGGFILTIIVALLVLIVRWRRIDRQNLERMRMRGARVVRGVTKERLEQLQITKYSKPVPLAALSSASINSVPDNEELGDSGVEPSDDICPICLIEFENGDDVRNMPCKHIFHVPCIDEWLRRNTLCPMCKSNVDMVMVDVSVEEERAATSSSAPLSPTRSGSIVIPIEE